MLKKTLAGANLQVSRIALGTAEIGFAYGIGKATLITETEAIDFLKKTVDLGVTFFDTANYYGLAEERIGKSGILKNPEIIVETKCAQFLEKGEYFSRLELEKKIREQVASSLDKLKIDCLPILMLHGPSKEQIEKGELIEIMAKLKKEGKFQFAGVSTRGEESPLAAIASDFFDVIMVAYSVLDQRMSKKVLPAAQKKNIGIVNRSVLLKGSLTSLREKLPPALDLLKKSIREAEKIADELGIDLPALAVRFTLSEPAITTTLIGTDKIEHIKTAVEAVKAGLLPVEIIKKLRALAITDPKQVDPAQWPKSN